MVVQMPCAQWVKLGKKHSAQLGYYRRVRATILMTSECSCSPVVLSLCWKLKNSRRLSFQRRPSPLKIHKKEATRILHVYVPWQLCTFCLQADMQLLRLVNVVFRTQHHNSGTQALLSNQRIKIFISHQAAGSWWKHKHGGFRPQQEWKRFYCIVFI